MSRKEKATVLYSRNGIKIEKVEFLDMTKWPNMKDVGVLIKTTVDQRLKRDSKVEVIPAKKAWKETITRTSKLGFYYYEIREHKAEPQKIINHDKYDAATYKKLVFKFDTKRYEMMYPIKCGDVSINKETRPWDLLPGTNGIEDHFITDLYKEVIKFFDICEDERIGYQIRPAYYEYNNSREAVYAKDMSWVDDIRKEVLRDLFGNENGPSVNYNDINILRHGFDLKQSFRKRKEL
jgi:hypothetical protein